MKILKKASSLAEALQIQAFLQSHGVDCDVPNRSSDTFFNYFSSPRIWVRDEDYDQAKELITNLENVSANSDEKEEHITEDPEEKTLKRALGAAILSIFVPVVANLYSFYLLASLGLKARPKYWLIFLVNLLSLYVVYHYYMNL